MKKILLGLILGLLFAPVAWGYDILGNLDVKGYSGADRGLRLKEMTAPDTTQNYGKIYTKSSDSLLYFLTDGGTEYELSGAIHGSGTAGRLMKWLTANSATDATNTDTDVASAVSLKHAVNSDTDFAQIRAEMATDTELATEATQLRAEMATDTELTNGLADKVDSDSSTYVNLVVKSHDIATGVSPIVVTGQEITLSDTDFVHTGTLADYVQSDSSTYVSVVGKAHDSATVDTGLDISGQKIYLEDTAVTPGAYTSSDITVDAQGRITSASSGAGGISGSSVSGNVTFWTGTSSVGGDTGLVWDNSAKKMSVIGQIYASAPSSTIPIWATKSGAGNIASYGANPSGAGYGVYGTSSFGIGTYGKSSTSQGVRGKSSSDVGVYGESVNNIGVYGIGGTHGVYGKAGSGAYGVYGVGAVSGLSTGGYFEGVTSDTLRSATIGTTGWMGYLRYKPTIDRWEFSNGDPDNPATYTPLSTGSGTAGYLSKWITGYTFGASTNTDTDVASAVTNSHTRGHTMASASDHTDWPAGLDVTELGYVNGVTSAIQSQIDLKANSADVATDTELANEAAQLRDEMSTDTELTDGLADKVNSDSSTYIDVVEKAHDIATAGSGISIAGQEITNSDTGSGAVATHNLAYDHTNIPTDSQITLWDATGADSQAYVPLLAEKVDSDSATYVAAVTRVSDLEATDTPTFAGLTITNRLDASKVEPGTVSNAEYSYLDGVSSPIQTQMNLKAPIADPTFTGTVTTPAIVLTAQSSCEVQVDSNITTTTGVSRVVVFSNEISDALEEYSTTTGLFTCTNAGTYLVSTGVAFTGNATGRRYVYIYRNALDVSRVAGGNSAGTFNMLIPLTALVTTTAGQTISIVAYQDSGITLQLLDAYTWLTIQRVR